MHRTVVLCVNGLTSELIGAATPNLQAFVRAGAIRPLTTDLPALAGPVQATFATGLRPDRHGVVADGWYVREVGEVRVGLRADDLVAGEKVWETGARRAAGFTCANLFWRHNQHGSATYAVAPPTTTGADGRVRAGLHGEPAELAEELTRRLGRFPLGHAEGPAADIFSSRWIAGCARHVYDTRRPSLTLVSLPHLDLSLARLGPHHPALRRDLVAVDALLGELIERVRRDGARVVVLSAYGFTGVRDAVHPNRALREAKLLRVRREPGGGEILDAGASEAFAVADHQVAHVYLRRPDLAPEVTQILETLPGVERVLDGEAQRAAGVAHPRAGNLVAVARADRWFSYYYWLDDAEAPGLARTVDPRRKPGHDPLELFLDPAVRWPALRIAKAMVRRGLGLRYAMDVTPLDTTLVKGSHGRPVDEVTAGPVVISSEPALLSPGAVAATAVKELILSHVFG